MSVESNYYVIAGYDLTGYETKEYDDYKYSKEIEKLTDNQAVGNIQLFDDSVCGSNLYLGYIFVTRKAYSFETQVLDVEKMWQIEALVHECLKMLCEFGAVDSESLTQCKYQLIAFEKCI